MSEEKMSVPDAMWASIALNRAEHRVAEAALKGEATGHGNHEICLWFDRAGDCEEFGKALDGLRRLKGEG